MKKSNGSKALGVGLVVVGLFFLLGQTNLIPSPLYHALASWPSILILIGIYNLAKGEYNTALVLFVVGGFFLFPKIAGPVFEQIWEYWPVLLIALGLIFILKPRLANHTESTNTYTGEWIDETAIFGGIKRHVTTQNFKGGSVKSIFGGTDLYFTGAQTAPEGALLEVTSIFGGTKLMIPSDWKVVVEVTSIFGGFEDKSPMNPNSSSNNVLRIKGASIFGGGEIYRI